MWFKVPSLFFSDRSKVVQCLQFLFVTRVAGFTSDVCFVIVSVSLSLLMPEECFTYSETKYTL